MVDKVDDIEYDRRNIIGWGPSGTVVLRGTIKSAKEPVAVKRFLSSQSKVLSDQFELFRTNVHENILQFHGVFSIRGFTYLALELCASNLTDYVNGRYKGPAVTVRNILQQTTQGLRYLHSIGVIHRNLKPANVLISRPSELDGQVTIKLSDFGIMSISGGKWPGADADSSEGWQAPELLKSWPASITTVTPAVDVFSLGCLYFMVLTRGENPFGPLAYFRDQKALAGQYDLDVLSQKMPVAVFLIECMIHRSPEYRPSIDEVMAQTNFWSLEF